jgi:hypothetical protein
MGIHLYARQEVLFLPNLLYPQAQCLFIKGKDNIYKKKVDLQRNFPLSAH